MKTTDLKKGQSYKVSVDSQNTYIYVSMLRKNQYIFTMQENGEYVQAIVLNDTEIEKLS